MAHPSQLFLWYGENDFAMNRELYYWIDTFEKKHSALNKHVINADEKEMNSNEVLMRLKEAVLTNSLFGGTKLVIVKNAFGNTQTHIKHELKILGLITTLSKNVFVVLHQTVPPNKAMLKKITEGQKEGEAKIKHFPLPTYNELSAWIRQYCKKQGVTIAPQALHTLINAAIPPSSAKKISSEIIWLIAGELDKTINYAYPRKTIEQNSIIAVVIQSAELRLWPFISCIMSNKRGEGAKLLEAYLHTIPKGARINEIRTLLNTLTREIHKMLIVKQMQTGNTSKTQHAAYKTINQKQLWILEKQARTIDVQYLRMLQKKLTSLYRALMTDPQTIFARLHYALIVE